MKKIGFIGLGAMGLPIADNILKSGYALYAGYHSNRKPAEQLADKGAVICESFREVAEHSDVVFTVVPDAQQVEEVIFGPNGLLEGLRPGTAIFDMSTIDMTISMDIGRRLEAQGIHFFDAPISGGPKGAQSAALSIMVGGDRTVFEDCRPVLEAIGKTIVYCGTNGLGLAAKMANNLIASSQMVAISEALTLAIKAGIDPEVLFDVLKGSTANSTILNMKFAAYLKDDYNPGFKLELMCKDLGIITSVAKKLGTPTLVGSLVEQIYGMCKKEHGDKDSGAVSLYYQQQTGVSFKARD
jgi:3-hydroxyisobutyrate dehydrogenase-like beta-hydroxyacid dehydrogenase